MRHRVLARYLKADLSPPLGYPGGPCHVVERIENNIRNPKLKEDLSQDVERGKSLSNPDASKVYRLDTEVGAGFLKRLLIGPHAQFRMDLRSITVPAVRVALASLDKALQTFRSTKSPAYDRYMKDMQTGTLEWVDPKTSLAIVVALEGRDTIKLVTTYWKGDSDPKAPGSCSI